MNQDKYILNSGQNLNNNFPTTEARTNMTNVPVAVPGADPATRLMGTRIVRIRFATKWWLCQRLQKVLLSNKYSFKNR